MGFSKLKSMQVIPLTNCIAYKNSIKHKKSFFEALPFFKIQLMAVKWLAEPHPRNL